MNWFEPGIELTEDELQSAQARLGVNFPRDYARMVLSHSGASNPDECEFEYLDGGRVRVGNFGSLLALREDQPETVFEALENLGPQLADGVIPVISTGSGDYVCLDYRDQAQPAIALFSHEKPRNAALMQLDATFDEFLRRLHTPEDE